MKCKLYLQKNGEKSNVIHKSVKTYLKHYFGSEELLVLHLKFGRKNKDSEVK